MKLIPSLLITSLLTLSFALGGRAQSLPIDFEGDVLTTDFIDFDGGMAEVIANPQSSAENASATVAQIVRDGGAVFAGSKVLLDAPLDLSTLSAIEMKVFTTAPVGTVVKFKLEGEGSTERDVLTTVSGQWETLRWDFTGTPPLYDEIVFMFDFGNVGDGSVNSTFLFDDIEQLFVGTQIDLPVDFEGQGINYTTTDFGGTISTLVTDPLEATNTVVQVVKTAEAATWAGTTIGTPAGFATDIPLTLDESIMTVDLWVAEAGIPVRLKVEDSNDPTHTCETEVLTTTAGWQSVEFDFSVQAPGTESLSVGLQMGWTFNMASLFFNFGTEGAEAGEQTYYFDEVRFGPLVSALSEVARPQIRMYPNPASQLVDIDTGTDLMRSVELIDLKGRRQLMQSLQSSHAIVPLTALKPGVYLLRVTTARGTKSEVLVVQ